MKGLGEKEKELWTQIEPILEDLLDELKNKGKIETVYVESELDKLRAVVRKVDEIGSAHNTLLDLFDQPSSEFLGATAKFGFDESKVIYMYVACAVTLAVLYTELFKLRLLFHMKDVSFDVSRFVPTIKVAAAGTWPRLQPHIDNAFRNALAHGTYAVIDKKIALFDDAKLVASGDPEREMTLDRFMMRVKECNVIYACLTSLLDRKISEGFFKSA
jgi:hypothetical protein